MTDMIDMKRLRFRREKHSGGRSIPPHVWVGLAWLDLVNTMSSDLESKHTSMTEVNKSRL